MFSCFQAPRPRTFNKPRYFKIKAFLNTSSSTAANPYETNQNELDISFQPLQNTNAVHSLSFTHGRFFPLDSTFPSNYISTTKYTLITFFPKSLLLQFRRFANIYFLITAILQCFQAISPLNPFSAVSPFVLVITLSMIREAFEDHERYKSDVETNRSLCNVLCNGVPLPHNWKEIMVGNLLLIKDEEPFPADMILMACDNPLGVCYIETSSLDGEKGLKAKNSLKETEIVKNTENLRGIQDWEVEAPVPDAMIYQFQGTITRKKTGNRLLLNQRQFLPRGARLKNSNWIIGVVIYTGFDTKVMRNTEKSKIKVSKIEKKTNQYLLFVLFFELFCCLSSAIGFVIWRVLYYDEHWYLNQSSYHISLITDGILTFLTYFLLNNTMIPISLIVSLEFVKVAQAFFINQDEDLFTEASKRSCKARTSSINEELGQVEYIFSDKTGTLTCNKMQFKSLIIGAGIYGSQKLFPDPNTSRSSVSGPSNTVLINDHLKLIPSAMKSSLNLKRGSTPIRKGKPTIMKGGIVDERSHLIYEFNDPRLRKLIKAQGISMEMEGFPLKFTDRSGQVVYELLNQKELVHEMLQMMSTCHECIIEKKKDSGYIHYQGQSPDEIAIVDAARHLGFKFLGNDQKTISLDILETKKELEILQSFEFNSNRKRMSIIIRENNLLKLYMKGADSKIKERLDQSVKQVFLKNIEEKIDILSKIGLRVLCFSMRIVSVEEYEEFLNNLKKIENLTNREEEIMKLAENLEKNCILVGATGVEDKLQDKVPETIHDLLAAKIRIWMLTGDKLETAENVGKSCQLIDPDMSVMRFAHTDLQECKKYMDECVDIYKLCVANNRKKALLIEGDALNILTFHHDLREKFIHISKNCEAVICCRVTPKQKADVVRLIKGHLNKVTLAVGDGANDVNMLQEADIGIGIYGQEGLRAVQASDFAIGEFQCLWKLLLVHGRWCYIRISEMILYFFYKNMVMTLPQFYFSFFCGFSGQTVFDDWYITLYNMIFTCFPLLMKAILDQDLDYREPNTKPNKKRVFPKTQHSPNEKFKERPLIKRFYHRLYYIGQGNCIFNVRNFGLWTLSAIFHSLLLFFASFLVFDNKILNSSGFNSDLWTFSISAFTIIVLIVTVRLGLITKNWTVLFILSLAFLSVFLYLAYIFFSNSLQTFLVFQSVIMTFSVMATFAVIFLVVGAAFALDLFAMVLSQEISSSLVSYFRILIKTGQEGDAQYYEDILSGSSPLNRQGIVSFTKKSRIPRPSIFFEALEERHNAEIEIIKRKQFQFINVVKAKSDAEFGVSPEGQVEKPDATEEENVVVSEDLYIQRNSSIKAAEKVIVV